MAERDDPFEPLDIDTSMAGTPLHEWLGCPLGQLPEFIDDQDDDEDE